MTKEMESQTEFRFMPITEIFKKKICSPPTFYSHVKTGKITLYKFFGRSFVDRAEFESKFLIVK